jgi:hypothetical protein
MHVLHEVPGYVPAKNALRDIAVRHYDQRPQLLDAARLFGLKEIIKLGDDVGADISEAGISWTCST